MNTVLGIVTMNAGDGMPGACLRQTLVDNSAWFNRTIVVDGALTEEASKFYDTIRNITVIDSPWEDDLLTQLLLITNSCDIGDWWMMLDDDETLSRSLGSIIGKAPGLEDITEILTPRITCINENGGNRFYPADGSATEFFKEEYKTPNYLRNHFVKITRDLAFSSASGGHHCVPYHREYAKKIMTAHPHYHIKAPEQYVVADCQKSMRDPMHERFTQKEANEYTELLHKNNIDSYQSYRDSVDNATWSDEFVNWATDHRYINTPVSRPYFWYCLMANPDLNPAKDFTWERAVEMLLSDVWRDNMRYAKRDGAFLEMEVTPYTKGKTL
jgi:hypothetical protein